MLSRAFFPGLLLASFLSVPVAAQVLKNPKFDDPPATVPETPLILRAQPAPTDQEAVDAAILRLRELMRQVAASDISAEEKQQAIDELIQENGHIFRSHKTADEWDRQQTVDSAIILIEQMIYETMLSTAPDERSRETLLRRAPPGVELQAEPAPLIAPNDERKDIVVTRDAEQDGGSHWWEQAALAKPAAADEGQQTRAPVAEAQPEGKSKDAVKVAFLQDDSVTTDMHDDTTVLRNVADDAGDLVLFGGLHLWVGGALQFDGYRSDELLSLSNNGSQESDTYVRRGEGILRAQIWDLGEVKVQYDFEADIYRDLYYRWISADTSQNVTLGNQKEPVGLDWQMGTKFSTAMESSAPSSAFGRDRSLGIRYNRWQALDSDKTVFDLWGDNRTYVTTSLGLYGEDLENTNDTNWAITGRISSGARRTEDSGFHIGFSGSYRDGEFDRIAPRPGLHDANRVLLATPEADTQALAAVEAMYTRGSLHGQAEFYFSDYSGGDIDGQGWGGYGQVGWLFGGKERTYRPQWGLWAPLDSDKGHIFEVFGRLGYTRGDDSENTWNALALLTLGGNWYFEKFRGSVNLIFADTRRDVSGSDSGDSITARITYLF
jgi:phosphate-selective porin